RSPERPSYCLQPPWLGNLTSHEFNVALALDSRPAVALVGCSIISALLVIAACHETSQTSIARGRLAKGPGKAWLECVAKELLPVRKRLTVSVSILKFHRIPTDLINTIGQM
ncbi:hypothetical protein WG66_010558, partial [Moniliophthora roreri]